MLYTHTCKNIIFFSFEQAKYRDPHTKIRYASPEEFARISYLPSDMVTGYLALRKANLPVP